VPRKTPAGAPCEECGKRAMDPRSGAGGKPYRCRGCRGSGRPHGTYPRYRSGCKCAECRAAAVEHALASHRRYRERHGVLPSTAWRRKHGHGPVYWVPEAVRLGVYARDGYICWLCGHPTDPSLDKNDNRFPSLDHVIPRSQGGDHSPANLRCAHRQCNARRGAPKEATS
jgi:5-methylcytosine-specific restriction endonuclease McrA